MLSSHSSLVSTVLNQDLVSLAMSGETVLALCILMDFSTQIAAIRMGVSIIYLKGSHADFSN